MKHPYGKKAKWALVKLCKGHKVRAEITDEDDYGRTVAMCTLPDGQDLSAEMVKMGLATQLQTSLPFMSCIRKRMAQNQKRKSI